METISTGRVFREQPNHLPRGTENSEADTGSIVRKSALLVLRGVLEREIEVAGLSVSSNLPGFHEADKDVLEKLAVQMYARGLSSRDIQDGLREATGDLVLSKAEVLKLTEILYKQFEDFQTRDLSSFDVEYVFLDALYESTPTRFQATESVLCAWGMTKTGERTLLHLSVGNKESRDTWICFLRDMAERGLRRPASVVCGSAPGLVKAVGQFPHPSPAGKGIIECERTCARQPGGTRSGRCYP
jgi:transposase-like protein